MSFVNRPTCRDRGSLSELLQAMRRFKPLMTKSLAVLLIYSIFVIGVLVGSRMGKSGRKISNPLHEQSPHNDLRSMESTGKHNEDDSPAADVGGLDDEPLRDDGRDDGGGDDGNGGGINHYGDGKNDGDEGRDGNRDDHNAGDSDDGLDNVDGDGGVDGDNHETDDDNDDDYRGDGNRENDSVGNKSKTEDALFQLRDDVVVTFVSVTAKHVRTKRYLRTIKCPGTHRTITFKYHKATENNVADIAAKRDEADVLLWTRASSSVEWNYMIKNRSPRQVWLFTSAESAYTSPPSVHHKEKVNGLTFNVTFGYHSKSEVYSPFGAYLPFTRNGKRKIDIWSKKPPNESPVAWASSHCDHKYWNRTAMVYHLSNLVSIEMYGICGDHKIPRNESGANILQKHKFYLAFENSCCSEYITEKFWMALALYEAVPIVIGAKKSELERLAPPNSFIYPDDFESAEDLATFIQKVGEDSQLYNKYHEWRNHGKVEVYYNLRVYPYWTEESACVLLRYLETSTTTGIPKASKVDPYGPYWLGSCKACGTHKWIQSFGLSNNSFVPPDL